jgi:hypothetical protein
MNTTSSDIFGRLLSMHEPVLSDKLIRLNLCGEIRRISHETREMLCELNPGKSALPGLMEEAKRQRNIAEDELGFHRSGPWPQDSARVLADFLRFSLTKGDKRPSFQRAFSHFKKFAGLGKNASEKKFSELILLNAVSLGIAQWQLPRAPLSEHSTLSYGHQ